MPRRLKDEDNRITDIRDNIVYANDRPIGTIINNNTLTEYQLEHNIRWVRYETPIIYPQRALMW